VLGCALAQQQQQQQQLLFDSHVSNEPVHMRIVVDLSQI
jgi:hypothetical protein